MENILPPKVFFFMCPGLVFKMVFFFWYCMFFFYVLLLLIIYFTFYFSYIAKMGKWLAVFVSIIDSCLCCSGVPEKTCALCNRGEKSLLGQGELKCYEPTSGFNPFKRQLTRAGAKRALSDADDTIGRSQQHLTWRRTRGPLKQLSMLVDSHDFYTLFCKINTCMNHGWL